MILTGIFAVSIKSFNTLESFRNNGHIYNGKNILLASRNPEKSRTATEKSELKFELMRGYSYVPSCFIKVISKIAKYIF